jgi:hypothetical protein
MANNKKAHQRRRVSSLLVSLYRVTKLANGATFKVPDLYAYIEHETPQDYDPDEMTPDGKEPKWQKHTRWAIQDCKDRNLIKHIGSSRSGECQRP